MDPAGADSVKSGREPRQLVRGDAVHHALTLTMPGYRLFLAALPFCLDGRPFRKRGIDPTLSCGTGTPSNRPQRRGGV